MLVQTRNEIDAMRTRLGMIALGPAAATSTGNEVKTITAFKSADLRTTLRSVGASEELFSGRGKLGE